MSFRNFWDDVLNVPSEASFKKRTDFKGIESEDFLLFFFQSALT
jgi:hypothetical protein